MQRPIALDLRQATVHLRQWARPLLIWDNPLKKHKYLAINISRVTLQNSKFGQLDWLWRLGKIDAAANCSWSETGHSSSHTSYLSFFYTHVFWDLKILHSFAFIRNISTLSWKSYTSNNSGVLVNNMSYLRQATFDLRQPTASLWSSLSFNHLYHWPWP